MGNEELKAKYDEMHKQGVSAWFNDGKEERELILKMGEPWAGLGVLEIGCGEGELAFMMAERGGDVTGLDYSEVAIEKANSKPKVSDRGPNPLFLAHNWDYWGLSFESIDRIVMQGVLEHLDDPFASLDAMITKFKPKSIITSSPCFLNPRGIYWKALHMIGGLVSKTDLHFLDPQDFEERYKFSWKDCDFSWGNLEGMVADLSDRTWKAIRDGKLGFSKERLEEFENWLRTRVFGSWWSQFYPLGATMVYRIDL